MKSLDFLTRFCVLGVSMFAGSLLAQDSAPSSHLVFDDRFAGDVIVNQIRVPKNGEALYTYYEALGWRGKGAGYAGIQTHPRAHNFIFSIWDHDDHQAPIRAVYRGPGTETQGFGGEGTGLKSWNFELGWSTDVWYTLVSRCWPVEDHTYFGFWVHAADTDAWTHLVTFDVATSDAKFEGGTDAFIEDWLNTGQHARTTQLRGGWKRKVDGDWYPFQQARYSVNAWDLEPGKRSFDFRKNWDGGTRQQAGESFYYMTSGGADTQPSTENPSTHRIERHETKPDFVPVKVQQLQMTQPAAESLRLTWEVEASSAPPFAFQVEVFDNEAAQGKSLISTVWVEPHRREAEIDLSKLPRGSRPRVVRFTCRDLFDRQSEAELLPLPTGQ